MVTSFRFQVYDVTVSYFLDGLGVGFDSTDTRGLVGQISDQEGVFLIGQNAKGKPYVYCQASWYRIRYLSGH